ncbi:MAG: prenyltransferase [Polyangiaceae bacterium]
MIRRALAWVRAARLPAQSNIAVPLLCGQALAYQAGFGFEAKSAVLVFTFGLFDQLAIVFSNDAADEETDRKNQTFTPFSGGSRVLVEGALSRSSLLRASFVCSFLALVSLSLLASMGRSWLLPFVGAFGLFLLWAYSFPPLRLSYRGGGEVLQVLGTGVVLPLIGFLGQGGAPAAFSLAWFALLVPIRLSCAIATALPDEPSDRASEKRTFVVLTSSTAASVAMFLLALVSFAAAMFVPGAAHLLLGLRASDLLPAFAFSVLALLFVRSKPGSRGMLVRAGGAVTATLLFELAISHRAFAVPLHGGG